MAGKTKWKTHSMPGIDMTPIVDLGFLLITFFILTTSMTEKKASTLIIPKDGDPTPLPESKALTAILGKDNKVFVYTGKWEDAVNNQKIMLSDYNVYHGLGSLIRQKQQQLAGKKDDLVLLIKPSKEATYQNIINALDEVLINNVQRYAVVETSAEERLYLETLR